MRPTVSEIELPKLRCGSIYFALLGMVLALHPGSAHAQTKRPLTINDFIQFAEIGDPESLGYNRSQRPYFVSPDGSKLAVIVRRGDGETNTNRAWIYLYDTAALSENATPNIVVEFSSATNNQPIAFARWLNDNRTIVFAGTMGSAKSQVFSVDTISKDVRQISKVESPLSAFDVTPSGEIVIVMREPSPIPPSDDEACLAKGCLVTATHLDAASRGIREVSAPLYMIDRRNNPNEVELTSSAAVNRMFRNCGFMFGSISPDGRHAFRTCEPMEWPSAWNAYDSNVTSATPGWARRDPIYASFLMSTDLQADKSIRIFDAPVLWNAAKPIWIDGGKSAILPGVFEPLPSDSSARRKDGIQLSVLLVNPANGRYARIAQLNRNAVAVTSALWDDKTETLTVSSANSAGEALPQFHLKRLKNNWAPVANHTPTPTAHPPEAVDFQIIQSPNDAPVLTFSVTKAGGPKRLVLLDPNPWLNEVALAKTEIVTWKSKSGRSWDGALHVPDRMVPGKRYPIVLQPYCVRKLAFSLNGCLQNYVAQALTAHGIVVLDVAINKLDDLDGTPAVLPVSMEGIESAIDFAVERGLADRSKVGIQGFSYSGPLVAHALTHSNYSFTAAAFTSTGVYGPWWYTMTGGDPEQDAIYRAPPFGVGMKGWLEQSPSLNLDRIRTPMLMWTEGVLGNWDWYSSLKRMRKPVEYWWLPDGQHNVFKVGERRMTYQLLVDWFRFWLKNEEDPSAEKGGQYARWHELSRLQDAARKEPRPPLLTWTATPVP